ncbi:MAG TPA: hypothetical protein VFS43_13375 [Polyangiaceae bacterium]|nr:hypothetical protein [Polyangiaceae bacterium]
MSTTLSPHDVRQIAVEAEADPRTVRKVLRGEPVTKGTAERRIKRALLKLGFVELAMPAGEQVA